MFLSPEQPPPAYPFPNDFQWSKDGVILTNTSRIKFGYPSIIFQLVTRSDQGVYTLRATNHVLFGPLEETGTAVGTVTLEVACEYRNQTMIIIEAIIIITTMAGTPSCSVTTKNNNLRK